MPVGRVRYAHMGPLSFEEFLEAFEEEMALQHIQNFRLGEEFSETLHERICSHLRHFLFTGGLPEVVSQFVRTRSLEAAQQVLEDVVSSYQDDFAKYAKHSQLLLLQTVLKSIPAQLGSKVFGLDVGFLNRILNLSAHSQRFRDSQLIDEGPLAEQFIAQHLADQSLGLQAPELFYWQRENPRSNAEIDFVIQHEERIVPLEVKAGKSGSLKSLLQFVSEKGSQVGVRFYGGLPQRQKVVHSLATPAGISEVNFTLLSLPLYFVGQLSRLLKQEFEG